MIIIRKEQKTTTTTHFFQQDQPWECGKLAGEEGPFMRDLSVVKEIYPFIALF